MKEPKIALVTGASRGAGRAIALELALAGYEVFITGRSRTGDATTSDDTNTLDHTKKIIEDAGGTCIAITCDHADDIQVEKVFEKIMQEKGRLDILVNNAWAGYMGKDGGVDTANLMDKFWEMPLWKLDLMWSIGIRSSYVASMYAARIMIAQKHGLIVNTGFWEDSKYIGNVAYDTSKNAVNRLIYGMAIDLKEHNVAAVAIGLGWIRSDHLKRLYPGLDDYNYKEFKDENGETFANTESARFSGRVISALANDEDVMLKTGKIYTAAELGKIYGVTDLDGSQPEPFRLPDQTKGITQR